MKTEHTTAQGPHEAGVREPADNRARPDDPALQALGFTEETVDPGALLDGRSKATAWGLGVAGIVAFSALALGAIAALDWLIPYLRYLYLVMLGSGSADM